MLNAEWTNLAQGQLNFTLQVAGMVALTNETLLGPFRSPGLRKLFGFESIESEIDQESLLSRLHPEDRERFKSKTKELLGRKVPFEDPFEDEMRIILPDGCIRYLQVKGMHRQEISDSDVRVYIVIHDVTRRRESEELLKRRSQELAVVAQKLKRYSAVVAHDLKNPVNSIVMASALLGETQNPTEVISYSNLIRDVAYRMGHLIDDLLEFAKLENEVDAPKENVVLSEILEAVRSDVQAALIQSGGRVEVDSNLPIVVGHRFQLKQLFQNLIVNALKFRSDSPPYVKITFNETLEYWRFSVRDNGIGLDAGEISRMFEPFQRLRAEQYEGTGLGLSICKKIVELHHGQISVHSKPGLETEFIFTLAKS
jgi:signal transduction histidine kinase